MPTIPELKRPLGDGQVQLRLAAERDIPEVLIAYQDDARLHLHLGEDRPPSGAQLGRRSECADAELADGERVRITILEQGADDCRGQITVDAIDWEQSHAQLTIWVAPQFRGRGVARRALAVLAPWLFDDCGLMRLALLVAPENEPMLRAGRAAGFVQEGMLRGHVRERRGRADRIVLSLLPQDVRR
jgi:RimJ/RimL family protein N-acetyltransferase